MISEVIYLDLCANPIRPTSLHTSKKSGKWPTELTASKWNEEQLKAKKSYQMLASASSTYF